MQTSAAPAVKPVADQVQLIPVEKIKPSPFNARKEFPKEYIAELGASIARDGQQTPVKVRPVKDGYELVFGECRWRGAMAGGVPVLKAIVEVMDDARAEHLCLIENIKRKDLTVFEEAEKLQRLHVVHKVKVDDLALQVGLAVRTVRENLKLAGAQPVVRQLVAEEKLSVSNAKLISRVAAKDQDALAKKAAGLMKDSWGRLDEPMTHEQLEKYIREHYMVDLRFAPFDVKQKGLACVAPSCAECPKMSANAKEEYPDLKGTFCLSTADFRKKLDVFMKIKAEEIGAQLLPAEKTEKLFNHWGDLEHDSGFLKAHDKKPDDEKNRSLKQLLGKEELAKRLYLVRTPKNELLEVLKSNDLDAAIKKEGRFKKKEPSYGGGYGMSKAEKEKHAKAKAAEAIRKKVASAAVGKLVEKIEQKGLPLALLRVLAQTLANNADHEMDERRGWSVKGNAFKPDKMKENELLGVIFEGGLNWELYATYRDYSDDLRESCKALGIDLKKIETEVKAAAEKPEPKAEPKKVKKAA